MAFDPVLQREIAWSPPSSRFEFPVSLAAHFITPISCDQLTQRLRAYVAMLYPSVKPRSLAGKRFI